jgi:hypothetical protein
MLLTLTACAVRASGSDVRQARRRDRNELGDPLPDPGRRRAQQLVDPAHRNTLLRRRKSSPQHLGANEKMGLHAAGVEASRKIAMSPPFRAANAMDSLSPRTRRRMKYSSLIVPPLGRIYSKGARKALAVMRPDFGIDDPRRPLAVERVNSTPISRCSPHRSSTCDCSRAVRIMSWSACSRCARHSSAGLISARSSGS